MARTVTTPAGDVWRVRRLWAPRLQGESLLARAWRRMGRARRVGRGIGESDPGCFMDFSDGLVVGLLVIAAVLLLIFFVIPLLAALVDVVILVVLTLLGIVARVLFRRPWVIEATTPARPRHTWRVIGWRASGEAVDDIADALAHGHPPPAGYELSPRPGTATTES